ncbi:MAG: glutamyl-tRNA reductase [Pseudomonadales bacterium]|jgi:glutamyl-tRNA reductase|nr:glutamyl-tRNA reductase [Pseudomonadales bacterium]
MNLLIVGINHTSAPVELREKVAFTPEQLVDALHDISANADLAEVAILSTCNRTEVIATSPGKDSTPVVEWLANYHGMARSDLESSIYTCLNREAALHAMRVASGLDSMVIGEPQILGQFKDCFEQARRIGTLGTELDHLAQTTFRIAKKVRTETAIGENSVSVASTAVTLAEQIFSDLTACNILLIGAGETIELVGRHLHTAGIRHLTIANRTLDNARRLAELFDGQAIDLQSIPGRLGNMDIVIASTASQLPILGKGTVERALKSRKHRPILMVDLAVPRDIEPEVASLRDIYLYSVDDLQEIIDLNLSNREQAAGEAEAIVQQEVANYRSRQELKAADELVVRFREQHMQLKESELAKALTRLEKGEDPTTVVNQLANQLTNKMIHTPSVKLKNAVAEGEEEFLKAVTRLYELEQNR